MWLREAEAWEKLGRPEGVDFFDPGGLKGEHDYGFRLKAVECNPLSSNAGGCAVLK